MPAPAAARVPPACSAAGHATWLGRCAASPSRACWPGHPGTSQPWRGPWPPRPRHHPARSPGPGGGARRRPARRTGAWPASRRSQSRRIARPARSSTLGTGEPRGGGMARGCLSTAGPWCGERARERPPRRLPGGPSAGSFHHLRGPAGPQQASPLVLGQLDCSSLSWTRHPPARPSPWIHATGAKSGQSHRSPLASRGNYWVACALRLAPVRSSGFRIPCRERAVELVGGRPHKGPGVGACRKRHVTVRPVLGI